VRSGMVGQLSHLGPRQRPTKGIAREQRDLGRILIAPGKAWREIFLGFCLRPINGRIAEPDMKALFGVG
jgi:hypothetical protein